MAMQFNRGMRCMPFQRQQGAVAIMVALSLVTLIASIGLVVDMGRMYVIKTELQNAADACALAAVSTLDGTANGLINGENAGVTVGARNRQDFQNAAVNVVPANVTFSATLNGSYQTAGAVAPGTIPAIRYAQCSLQSSSISMRFMQALGIGNQSVPALAVATFAPSQKTCAIPLGLCAASPGSGPSFGLITGNWYSGRAAPGAGGTGSYGWIDFTPPGGGANEIGGLLEGNGQCNLPPNGTLVGQQGVVQSLSKAWNSRFGLYKGASDIGGAPPDFTGYGYSLANWPEGRDAYSGSSVSGAPNYQTAVAGHMPYQGSLNGYNNSTSAELTAVGSKRRVVVAPVVDCSAWAGSGPQTVPILGYGCVLMLDPIDHPGTDQLEYLGNPGAFGTPCGGSGLAGGTSGPLVPVLAE